jgi:biotin operon repressor
MLRGPAKRIRGNNVLAKEIAMTRTDVRKLAWTLRLIGYGMLAVTVSLMLFATQLTSAAPSMSASARLAK